MVRKYCITKYSVISCHLGRKALNEEAEKLNFKKEVTGLLSWVQSSTCFTQTALLDRKLVVKDAKADNDGHVAVILWHATSEGNVGYALKLTAGRNDESQVIEKNFGSNSLPGYPLYYYVDTNIGKVFAIRPDTSIHNGRLEFEEVMREYMSYYSEGSQMPLTNDNGEVFVPLPAWKRAVFSLRMDSVAIERDSLLDNAEKIYKLVHVVPLHEEVKGAIDTFLSYMGQHLGIPDESCASSHVGGIRYEREITVSADELTAILEREGELRGMERIGFRQKGTKGNILWADKVLERKSVALNLRERQGVLTADGILLGCKQAVMF